MTEHTGIATPNANLDAWYLIGRLESRMEQDRQITVESWNKIMWDASNATRFQR
jgi:hypothetical protein